MSIVSDESQFTQLSFLESITDSESHSQESIDQEETGRVRTSSFGEAGENLVAYLFHMWNYNICKPMRGDSAYDLVVERDDVFKKIQVKHTANNSLRIQRNIKGKQQYQEGNFDYVCAVSFPNVYVIPWNKLQDRTWVIFNKYPEYCYDLNDPTIYNYRPTI